MTIFRNTKTGKLYKIYHVSPPKFTGSWYECQELWGGPYIPLSGGGRYSWKNFIEVAHR